MIRALQQPNLPELNYSRYSNCRRNSTVDISLLLKREDEEDRIKKEPSSPPVLGQPGQDSSSNAGLSTRPTSRAGSSTGSVVPAKRPARMTDPVAETPAKRQSKWSAEEDSRIIQLRGDGMKWEDISKHLPGRSAISCRLHYQNYLERRSEWDEDRKNKLARLYERFKAEMWARIAEEMQIPWRAAEAMHWQMGEGEMAKRAGVVPFVLSNAGSNNNPAIGSGRLLAGTFPHRNTSQDTRLQTEAMPAQLPSLAELTAGLPAYAADPRSQYQDPILTPPIYPSPSSNSYFGSAPTVPVSSSAPPTSIIHPQHQQQQHQLPSLRSPQQPPAHSPPQYRYQQALGQQQLLPLPVPDGHQHQQRPLHPTEPQNILPLHPSSSHPPQRTQHQPQPGLPRQNQH